jgi:hypothetical protein
VLHADDVDVGGVDEGRGGAVVAALRRLHLEDDLGPYS